MPAKIDIEDGQVVFGRTALKNTIRELEDGTYWVDPQEWKRDMSWQQIKFVKGVLRHVYSNYTGYTVVRAERELKREFGIVEPCIVNGEKCIELVSFSDPRYNVDRMGEFITDVLNHMEYDCNIIIDPKVRKQYRIDELTGELKEITEKDSLKAPPRVQHNPA